MKRFCRLGVSLLVSLALFPAPTLLAGEVVDRVLIHVNSRIISEGLFESRFEQVSRETGPPANAAKREEMKKTVFEELVNEALLEDRAKELDLITSDQEIEDQIKKLKEANNVTSDEEFVKALASTGLTVDRLRDQLRKSLTVQRVVGREVNSKVDLSDDALRVIYEREKDTWKIPEKAHLAEVLIANGESASSRAAAERKAKEASDLLKKGAKFEAVAAQYSDGATKNRGGDLGIVAKGELNPEIDKAVFSLPSGGVTDPIASKFGWHIVKLVEKLPATFKPFSEVKADLLKREQETQFQKKLAEYLEKLKQEAVIKVSPEAAPYYTAPVASRQPDVITTTAVTPDGAVAPRRQRSDPRFEIAPTAGWRFGGLTSETGNAFIESIKVPDTLSWGVSAEYALKPWGSVELLWSHQDTELRATFTDAGAGFDQKITHLNIDTFQIGGLWNSGDPSNRARLYVDLLVGVSLLTPSPEFHTLTRFSASVGGGIKLYLTDNIGAKFGLRWLPVYINSSSSGYSSCSPYYGCYTYFGVNYLSQGDASASLLMRF